jgi:UDP-3-O-[3-hydroxymyristoyl] glucosamine N-acyltransferase
VAATVRQLADLIQGKGHGDGDQLITEARSLVQAQAGHITFVESDRHARRLADCRASAVVVPRDFPVNGRTIIQAADPLTAFITIVQHLRGKEAPPAAGVDPRAVVHPSVTLGPGCSVQALASVGEGTVLGARCRVYPGAVIGRNCRLGDDVIVYPNAVLYDHTVLGHRVVVHANAVLGADGFGYRTQQGRHVKVPQLGSVIVEDDVEIGACTTIDRGTFDATRIGTGTKIDNLVQIAHNCQIGPHNLLVSQVGIAGSSTTGAYVVMAGQVGVADHVHIGDQAVLGTRSGASADLPGGESYLGTPATPAKEHMRIVVALTRLPEMRQELRRIKKHLGLKDEEAA